MSAARDRRPVVPGWGAGPAPVHPVRTNTGRSDQGQNDEGQNDEGRNNTRRWELPAGTGLTPRLRDGRHLGANRLSLSCKEDALG